MKREDLKNIIKECIRELVKEGVFGNVKQEESLSLNEAKAMKEEYKKEMASSLARSMSKNNTQQKMFQSIFEDTAEHTLKNKLIAEGKIDKGEALITEEDIVRDEKELKKLGSPANWAKLAFSKKR